MFKEFKPALLFLGKFLGIYIVGNLVYGMYINHYYPESDPVTKWISFQVSEIISITGHAVRSLPNPGMPTVSLVEASTNNIVVNVFEGCNGINVVIVFMAFLVAYQGTTRRTIIFSLIGLLVIHVCNLARIVILFQQAKNNSPYFYYFHKYFFTATLYVVVAALWWFWVTKFNGDKK